MTGPGVTRDHLPETGRRAAAHRADANGPTATAPLPARGPAVTGPSATAPFPAPAAASTDARPARGTGLPA